MSNDLTNDLLDMFNDHHIEPPNRQSIVRAPFSQAGSKLQSIPYLNENIPVRNKWIDVFGGTGVVTLNRSVSPVLEVFNDRYGGIVAFYRCLRDVDKWKQMKDYLENILHSREDFYFYKQHWVTETDDVKRAAQWFYVLQSSVIGKMDCFARTTNSVCGFPVASSIQGFFEVHKRFKKVLVENLDFETCIRDFDSEDAVFYCDPPYIETDPGVYQVKWTVEDLNRLLHVIGQTKGFVALSSYDDARIDIQTYWTKKVKWKMKARAEVRAFTDENRKKDYINVQQVDTVEEVLWIKD